MRNHWTMIVNLYVNDVQDHFSSSSVQYADDTTIYETCKPNDVENAQYLLNNSVRRVNEWSDQNSLAANAVKMKYLLCASKHLYDYHTVKEKEINLTVGSTQLYLDKELYYLGIYLDQHLDWEKHLKYILSTCYRQLSMPHKMESFTLFSARNIIIQVLFKFEKTGNNPMLNRAMEDTDLIENRPRKGEDSFFILVGSKGPISEEDDLKYAHSNKSANVDFGTQTNPVEGYTPYEDFVALQHTVSEIQRVMQASNDNSDSNKINEIDKLRKENEFLRNELCRKNLIIESLQSTPIMDSNSQYSDGFVYPQGKHVIRHNASMPIQITPFKLDINRFAALN